MLKTGFMQKKQGHDWGGGGYSDVSVNYRTNHVDSIIVSFALPPPYTNYFSLQSITDKMVCITPCEFH